MSSRLTFFQIPIARALVPFIAGILLKQGNYFTFFLSLIVLIALVILPFIHHRKRSWTLYLVMGFNLMLGHTLHTPIDVSSVKQVSQKFKGTIILEKILKQTPEKCSFTFTTKNNKFICYYLHNNGHLNLSVGDSIRVQNVSIKYIPPPPYSEKEKEKYNSYYLNNGIKGTIFLKPKQIVQHYKSANIYSSIYRFRRKVTNQIINTSVFEENEFGIFLSLLLGEKSYLTSKVKDSYKKSGVIHVLAISGLHVGVVYLFFTIIFKILFLHHKQTQFFIVTAGLLFYAAMSGFSPSVLRACIMCILLQFGKMIGRKNSSLNVVFVSGYVLLLYNSNYLFDIGFQLSYCAVSFIIYGFPILSNLYAPKSQVLKHALDLHWVNCLAFLGTTPLLLFHFEIIYLGSLLAGLLIVPLISLVLIIGVFCLPFIYSNTVFSFGLNICNYLLLGVNYFVNVLSSNYSFAVATTINEMTCYLLSCLFITILTPNNKVQSKLTAVGLLTLSILICTYLF